MKSHDKKTHRRPAQGRLVVTAKALSAAKRFSSVKFRKRLRARQRRFRRSKPFGRPGWLDEWIAECCAIAVAKTLQKFVAQYAASGGRLGPLSQGREALADAARKSFVHCEFSPELAANSGDAMSSSARAAWVAPIGQTSLVACQHERSRMDSEQPDGSPGLGLDLSAGPVEFPAKVAGLADLRSSYFAAVDVTQGIWSKPAARRRFEEYDRHRLTFCSELWRWLYGGNPRQIHTLTRFAWSVTHTPINGGGVSTWCLDFNERNQRCYLGDGLLVYLGLLKDAVEKIYNREHCKCDICQSQD